jgi:UDP-GlcNAc3NAcA epimerase
VIKIVTIVGARPQIIKAAALSRAIREHFSTDIHEIIAHTGQHYDYNMSDAFINELSVTQPHFNLNIGSSAHGTQTASMIQGIEEILFSEKPQWCILFGDTNSTLAGAVAAAKLNIPIAHIEAGLRSYDKTMPEELNRIVCDHFSTVLFTPTLTANKNLHREGFSAENKNPFSINNPAVMHYGDVMYDNTLFFREAALEKSEVLKKLSLTPNEFALCTIHRPHNTDNSERLTNILSAMIEMAETTKMQFVLPLHPRTAKILKQEENKKLSEKLQSTSSLHIIEPVSFFDMYALEASAKIILTDSGGVQKEAYFMKKPCVILRNETEWVEIIDQKAGSLADADPDQIKNQTFHFLKSPPTEFPKLFGDGKAANKICKWLIHNT